MEDTGWFAYAPLDGAEGAHLHDPDLRVDVAALDRAAAATDGVTASFLKELVRRAAVIAAASRDPGGETAPVAVSQAHLDEALVELMGTRNAMTRAALGGRRGGRKPRDPR